MGRTSKFTFPLPGRRPKPATHEPNISGPMSKAQKILGSAEINVDGPGRHWDAVSSSGISISVSESTAPSRMDTNTDAHPGDDVASGRVADVRARRAEMDEESDIVPPTMAARPMGLSRMNTNDSSFREHASETSTPLRKRQSSSTISSWYDKSKMPLSISQQTSASAMAKGLPPKAGALLDLDSSLSAPGRQNNQKPKKKPSRLDLSLSNLLPSRHRNQSNLTTPTQNSVLLGGDLVTKSPSIVSMSPMATPPPIKQRSLRNLTRKATKERMNELAASTANVRPATSGSNRRGAGQASGLQNLYEHYEQMSFRQVMGGDFDEAGTDSDAAFSPKPPPVPPKNVPKTHVRIAVPAQEVASPPQQLREQDKLPRQPVVVTKPVIREPDASSQESPEEDDYFNPNMPTTPNKTLLHGHGLISPPVEYASSVSSRHTRTSKASKRTNNSFTDADLQQSSVLSLSSDSEEDDIYSASKSSPSRPSSGDEPMMARSATSPAIMRPGERSPAKPGKRATFAPEPYLTIPESHQPVVVRPPAPNPRTSSLAGPTTVGQGGGSRSSSRMSVLSTSTTNSTAWQDRPGFGIHEARSLAILPRAVYQPPPPPAISAPSPHQRALEQQREIPIHAPQPRSPPRHSPPRILSVRSHSSLHSHASHQSSATATDQPTPPLSPSSVDFYMRSAGSSVDGVGAPNPRFMAVTKQEEMLLAALRMKRARMRESILSDLEDELRGEMAQRLEFQQQQQLQQLQQQRASQLTPIAGPLSATQAQLRDNTQRVSTTSNLTAVPEHGSRSGRSSRSGPPAPLTLGPTYKPDHSSDGPRILPGQHLLPRESLETELSPLEGRQERVPLYIDEQLLPRRHQHRFGGMDAIARSHPHHDEEDSDAEPSPDLSDFMDFDGSTSEDEGEEFVLHAETGAAGGSDLVAERTSSKVPVSKIGVARSPVPEDAKTEDSAPLTPSHLPVEGVHVVEGSDNGADPEAGIPRPDSPVSPDGPLALPVQGKKKAVRLSAVGRVGMEAGWWGDDG